MSKLIHGFHQKGERAAMTRTDSNLAGRNIPDNRDKDIVRNSLFKPLGSNLEILQSSSLSLFSKQEMEVLLNRLFIQNKFKFWKPNCI